MSFSIRLVNRLEMPEKTILVCEDDLYHAAQIVSLISGGYGPRGKVQVIVCPGAVFAAQILANYPFKIDLILLDHDMPYGNGEELLHWMKKQGLQILVIGISGIRVNNDWFMKQGAIDAVQKKDIPEQLLERIAEYL